MAALCPGVQYGLSSQENLGENKDLIFVKLTDSALRTIEEYLRNQSKYNNTRSPTIQFLGNDGQLSFPNSNGSTTFNFTVSSTSDMEGPGGSFECLQQPPKGTPLGVLGPITHKIRIHANDDVYETTRHRMSVLEENTKNKCAREIKMNNSDIGRKVKVKQVPGRSGVPPMRNGRDSSSSSSIPLRDSLQMNSVAKTSSYPPSLPSSKPLTNGGGSGSGGGGSTPNGLLSNGLGSNHVSSSKPPNKPSIPDIARRPIKERMIHLLALKPFKKPELFDRLTREGLREKKAMMAVLKQIAFLKDNCYHLNRAMWNDVHEDWPFYTESERQILKRRKPQNLTPPGSSDGGSSGSGHSPTSTHPGSPPPPISSSSSSSSAKRPGYFDNVDGVVSKRQRISHYRKPLEQTYRSPVENNSQRRPMTDSRDASNMNPRSRESPPIGSAASITTTNGYHNAYHHQQHHSSTSSSIVNGNNHHHQQQQQQTANSYTSSTLNNTAPLYSSSSSSSSNNTTSSNNNINAAAAASSSLLLNDKRNNNNNLNLSDDEDHGFNSSSSSSRKRACDSHSNVLLAFDNNGSTSGSSNGKTCLTPPPLKGGSPRNAAINDSNVVVMNGTSPLATKDSKDGSNGRWSNSRVARVSPDSQSDRCLPSGPINGTGGASRNRITDNSSSIYPDYLDEYTDIKDREQRRRYKADFNANYAEYRELHGVVEKVSRRFVELKERLRKENASSSKYKDIKKQIVKEYQLNQQDWEHQKAKQRFQYLHDKLSHIKRLVSEYDESQY